MEPTLAQIGEAYSDFYKSVHGIRPRWISGWSKDDYAKAWQALEREADEEFLERGRRCIAAQRKFEEAIQANLDLGAVDRATAIRWFFEANGYQPYEGEEAYTAYEVQNMEGVLWDLGYDMGVWPFIMREFFPNYVGGSMIRNDLTYEECTETKCVYVPTVAELQAMAA